MHRSTASASFLLLTRFTGIQERGERRLFMSRTSLRSIGTPPSQTAAHRKLADFQIGAGSRRTLAEVDANDLTSMCRSHLVEKTNPGGRSGRLVKCPIRSDPNICRDTASRSCRHRHHGEPRIRANHWELVSTVYQFACSTKRIVHAVLRCRPSERAQLPRAVEWLQPGRDRRQLPAHIHDRLPGHSAVGSRLHCCRLQRVNAE